MVAFAVQSQHFKWIQLMPHCATVCSWSEQRYIMLFQFLSQRICSQAYDQ